MNIILDTNIWISFLFGRRLLVESVVRDAKDVYLLAMAKAIPAELIVTGDKDLLVLGQCGNTQIVSFNELMQLLSSFQGIA